MNYEECPYYKCIQFGDEEVGLCELEVTWCKEAYGYKCEAKEDD
jgi:hypothetical protein